MKSRTEKLSISLSASLVQFIKKYQVENAYKSKSEVIQEAIKLLRKQSLENEYMQANAEADSDFDITSSDGL